METEDLKNGEGGVFEIEETKVAAYRDEKGTLITLSAKCMHRGCTVAFNKKDKTWDCPCHGSKYKYDGTVIHGPATKNLLNVTVKEDKD
jgi:Rieske Fe-S protein